MKAQLMVCLLGIATVFSGMVRGEDIFEADVAYGEILVTNEMTLQGDGTCRGRMSMFYAPEGAVYGRLIGKVGPDCRVNPTWHPIVNPIGHRSYNAIVEGVYGTPAVILPDSSVDLVPSQTIFGLAGVFSNTLNACPTPVEAAEVHHPLYRPGSGSLEEDLADPTESYIRPKADSGPGVGSCFASWSEKWRSDIEPDLDRVSFDVAYKYYNGVNLLHPYYAYGCVFVLTATVGDTISCGTTIRATDPIGLPSPDDIVDVDRAFDCTIRSPLDPTAAHSVPPDLQGWLECVGDVIS